jgi:hypothetical protein
LHLAKHRFGIALFPWLRAYPPPLIIAATLLRRGHLLLIAFNILIVSIASMPALVIADAAVLAQIIALLGIGGLAAAAFDAGTTDVEQTSAILRPVIIAMVLPVIWMVFQAIPMPITSLSHSIWASASSALQENLSGHISIDPGKTIDALFRYVSAVTLIVSTILVARHRRRAEQTLLALSIVSTLTTLVLLVVDIEHWTAIEATSNSIELLTTVSATGFILDLTAAIRVFERYESRRHEPGILFRHSIASLAACAAGGLFCLYAFVSVANVPLRIIAAIAAGLFIMIQVIRRLTLVPRLIMVLCLIAIMVALGVAVWSYDNSEAVSFVLHFAKPDSSEAITTTQTMVADVGWLGNGAGTFQALLPVYRGASATIVQAPTTAAKLVIEWGWPAMVIAVAAVLWLVVVLFRGALLRGRDSFYSAAAAACTVILLGQAFCDASLSQTAVGLLGEAAIGLGLAQSISRVG